MIQGISIRRQAGPAEDMMQAFAYRQRVPGTLPAIPFEIVKR